MNRLALIIVLFLEVTKASYWVDGAGWRYEVRVSSVPFEESFGRAEILTAYRPGKRMKVGQRFQVNQVGKDCWREVKSHGN